MQVFLTPPCLTVDSSSSVVIWECNQTPWQQWIFTEEGVLALANNTGTSLTYVYIHSYILNLKF